MKDLSHIDFAYWDREACFDAGYQAGVEGKCLPDNPFADTEDWTQDPLQYTNQYLWWEEGMFAFIREQIKLYREERSANGSEQ